MGVLSFCSETALTHILSLSKHKNKLSVQSFYESGVRERDSYMCTERTRSRQRDEERSYKGGALSHVNVLRHMCRTLPSQCELSTLLLDCHSCTAITGKRTKREKIIYFVERERGPIKSRKSQEIDHLLL
ncbi:hypothetical protein CIPAW_10G074500 [Carya illinoinensis]|uniref:Uncharacterized protein n=1 Tax=Carya illinoinensis TaxID=32201 RepID=A0A8T1PA76_CARIL|nr:hypothetical protein CIPAW_10G074500 [Carya illinoinensis]